MVSAVPDLPTPSAATSAAVKEATPDIVVDADYIRRNSALWIDKGNQKRLNKFALK